MSRIKADFLATVSSLATTAALTVPSAAAFDRAGSTTAIERVVTIREAYLSYLTAFSSIEHATIRAPNGTVIAQFPNFPNFPNFANFPNFPNFPNWRNF
ncbi:hypothetical protein ABIB90_007148 [Bradyrhizobium sp. JR4.1]|uniref:hypothetical protein n=1 Tax=Bradyrhizobium sp. JR4.1 TaxID=3156372 RepID=UPI00339120BC